MAILAFVGAVVLLLAGLIFVPRTSGIVCLWVALSQAGFLGAASNAAINTFEGFLLVIFVILLVVATIIAVLCDIAHLTEGTFFVPD